MATLLSEKFHDKESTNGFELCGLNTEVRFYKYEKGQFFAPHTDGGVYRDDEIQEGENGETFAVTRKTFLTLLLYLNTPLKGGETEFLNRQTKEVEFSVKPICGRILFFIHKHYHQARAVELEGDCKYVLRTDVMYKKLRKLNVSN